jgi:hypothetical protein
MGTEHEGSESYETMIDPKTPMSFFFNLTPSVQKSLVWALAFAVVGTAAAFCTAMSIESIHRYKHRTETSIFNKENR